MKQCITLIGNEIKDFHPAYFAMVMATGIVSIAFEWMAFPKHRESAFCIEPGLIPDFMRHPGCAGMAFCPILRRISGFFSGQSLAFFNVCGGHQYPWNAACHIPAGQRSGDIIVVYRIHQWDYMPVFYSFRLYPHAEKTLTRNREWRDTADYCQYGVCGSAGVPSAGRNCLICRSCLFWSMDALGLRLVPCICSSLHC